MLVILMPMVIPMAWDTIPAPELLLPASNTFPSMVPPTVSLKSTNAQLMLNPRLTPRPPLPTMVDTTAVDTTVTDTDTEDTMAVDTTVTPDTDTVMAVTSVNLISQWL